jgi:hypothetical protein
MSSEPPLQPFRASPRRNATVCVAWRKKALRLRRPSLCLRTMRVRERVTVWPEGEAHVPACVGARLYLFGDGLEVEVLDPPDLELAATPLFLAPQVPLEIRLRTEHKTD